MNQATSTQETIKRAQQARRRAREAAEIAREMRRKARQAIEQSRAFDRALLAHERPSR